MKLQGVRQSLEEKKDFGIFTGTIVHTEAQLSPISKQLTVDFFFFFKYIYIYIYFLKANYSWV